jgi:hypothetical protein
MTAASYYSFYNKSSSNHHFPLPLKVTICWYDPPNPLSFLSKLLLNDIDLYVRLPEKDNGRHSSVGVPSAPPVRGPGYPPSFIPRKDKKEMPSEPRSFYFMGNKRNGIYSDDDIFREYVTPDDKNPNEQILIEDSRCYPEDYSFGNCVFTVIINTRTLSFDHRQSFALFISTYGKALFLCTS